MAVGYNPRVVTDGLVLALDAGNPKNYNAGISTNWMDKVGGNNGALVGGTHHSDGPFVGAGYVEFDGNTDKLSCTPSNLTGQFTIEGWWHATAFTSASVFFGKWGYECLLRISGGNIEWYSAGNISGVSASYTFNTGQWYHLAVSRDSSNVHRVFIDGVQVLSTTDSDSITMTNFCIGAQSTDSTTDDIWTGYISNFRIVNGTALYTSDFTPPTKSLTAITNTSLLTCQGNTIADASSSALSITTGGDAAANLGFPASAFEFDGSGDYVGTFSNTDFLFGTEEFAIEWWEYFTHSAAYAGHIGVFENDNIVPNIWTYLGTFRSRIGLSGTWATISMSPLSNQWAHYVMTGVSGNIRFYQNGELKDTKTWDWSATSSTSDFAIGGTPGWSYGNYAMSGKFSSVRVYKGKSLSTAEVQQNYNATKGRYA